MSKKGSRHVESRDSDTGEGITERSATRAEAVKPGRHRIDERSMTNNPPPALFGMVEARCSDVRNGPS